MGSAMRCRKYPGDERRACLTVSESPGSPEVSAPNESTRMDRVEKSYVMQARDEVKMAMPSAYTAPQSIDNWRHVRMRSFVNALVAALPDARWMTVGDGRYGSDAAYIESLGADVLATSLTDESLKVACDRGFIRKFRVENAERLSCADNAFDFSFCKEAYHHFPRPPIALYEMLRAARIAIILIEPAENAGPLDILKTLAKRILRGSTNLEFEPSGNFIYRIRVDELSKLMTAMGGLSLAHKAFNDFYVARFGRANSNTFSGARILTVLGITVQNLLCRLRLMGWGLSAVVLFKSEISPAAAAALKKHGFKIISLPQNPYV